MARPTASTNRPSKITKEPNIRRKMNANRLDNFRNIFLLATTEPYAELLFLLLTGNFGHDYRRQGRWWYDIERHFREKVKRFGKSLVSRSAFLTRIIIWCKFMNFIKIPGFVRLFVMLQILHQIICFDKV